MPRLPPDQLTPGCRLLAGLVAGGGERLATAMLYLSSVQWGGNTVFPQLGLSVTPEVGAVIIITVVMVIMIIVTLVNGYGYPRYCSGEGSPGLGQHQVRWHLRHEILSRG